MALTLGMLVGFVLYGAATLRARVLPRWYGLVLILAMPVLLPLSVYGTALFGLSLVVLGYGSWLHRGAATGQPSRVSFPVGSGGLPVDFWYGFSAGPKWRKREID